MVAPGRVIAIGDSRIRRSALVAAPSVKWKGVSPKCDVWKAISLERFITAPTNTASSTGAGPFQDLARIGTTGIMACRFGYSYPC
jgi:hypothetical protein